MQDEFRRITEEREEMERNYQMEIEEVWGKASITYLDL